MAARDKAQNYLDLAKKLEGVKKGTGAYYKIIADSINPEKAAGEEIQDGHDSRTSRLKQQYREQYQKNLGETNRSYDGETADAYAEARKLTGQTGEILANMGLSRGKTYPAASGYAEDVRKNQEDELQNEVKGINGSRQSALDSLKQQYEDDVGALYGRKSAGSSGLKSSSTSNSYQTKATAEQKRLLNNLVNYYGYGKNTAQQTAADGGTWQKSYGQNPLNTDTNTGLQNLPNTGKPSGSQNPQSTGGDPEFRNLPLTAGNSQARESFAGDDYGAYRDKLGLAEYAARYGEFGFYRELGYSDAEIEQLKLNYEAFCLGEQEIAALLSAGYITDEEALQRLEELYADDRYTKLTEQNLQNLANQANASASNPLASNTSANVSPPPQNLAQTTTDKNAFQSIKSLKNSQSSKNVEGKVPAADGTMVDPKVLGWYNQMLSEAEYGKQNQTVPTQQQINNFVDIALQELKKGFKENVPEGQKDSDNINPYGKWYGNNGAAWCAMFISYCANSAGIMDSVIPKFQSCNKGIQWYTGRNRYKEKGSGYEPKAGDLIFFKYPDSKHVGIVSAYDPITKTVYTVEGNFNDALVGNHFKLGDSKIIGYGVNWGSSNGTISNSTNNNGSSKVT